ncbi:MAG: low molecular weight phosphotyrosine protein phosphatase [Proteobacteria bacterium]|nr:low molecular weight phosphotyrosine protein phosphatase [Pseudomonadota bacterium]
MKQRLKRWLGLGAPPPLMQVLMVCSGNICRSPTAEAVLRARLDRAGLGDRIAVDSAGTHGFHVKEPPDPRAQQHARQRGYDLSPLRARRVVGEDFVRFRRILAMDEGHLQWLQEAAPPDASARVELLMNHAARFGGQTEVPDPYYGSAADFEKVLDLVEDACDGLVPKLAAELQAELARPQRVEPGPREPRNDRPKA